jgi:hypothetical protein
MVIATDRKQARVIFRYVAGLLHLPMLASLIEREAAEEIDLANGVSIEIHVASYRTTRGYTLAAVLCDEIAFWRSDDSADPDYAILDALRPGLGTLPGAMLLCASSPYAQSGALHDVFRRYHGQNDAPVLVWRAPTRLMNPTFPQATIDAAMERDPSWASSEYLAEFRTDVQAFVAREAVEACVSRGVFERPAIEGVRYVAFCDPSGGSSDSMTLAIAHLERDVAILDCVRERRPPFAPDDVVAEFAAVLRSYRLGSVRGDRYGGEWPRERFAQHGTDYRAAGQIKSEIYLCLLPAINSRRVDLCDHPRLIDQLIGLERRTARGGRDSIDHRPGSHDDICNAAAGALVLAAVRPRDVLVGPVIGIAPRVFLGDGSPDLVNPTLSPGGLTAVDIAGAGPSVNPALGFGGGDLRHLGLF